MTAALAAIDAAYAESGGPFFLGAEMSLADVLVRRRGSAQCSGWAEGL